MKHQLHVPLLACSLAVTVLPFAGTAHAVTFDAINSVVTYATPTSGLYDITAAGAQGGSAYFACFYCVSQSGGLGSRASGRYYLNAGDQLTIAVGGQGYAGLSNYAPAPIGSIAVHGGAGGGGGGGSFVSVARGGNDLVLLVGSGATISMLAALVRS